MGCKLPKPRGSDEVPGKIYSTLRKAQVETHIGVAYTYHFLDFLVGKEEVAVSSLLCLPSVRELPVQMCELYQQGFTLAAVHPFVHSSGPDGAELQRQLYRAVLIRETQRCSETCLLKCVRPRLETEVCFSGIRVPDLDEIQNYVKKVQDQADLGVLFVGFVQQPDGASCLLEHCDPDDDISLNSSPSTIPQHTKSPRETCGYHNQGGHLKRYTNDQKAPLDLTVNLQKQSLHKSFPVEPKSKLISHSYLKDHTLVGQQKRTKDTTHKDMMEESRSSSLKAHLAKGTTSSNANRPEEPKNLKRCGKYPGRTLSLNRVQVFALYNHATVLSGSPRFYSLKIPLQVHKEAGLITTVNAHWLDYMTQHFRRGAQLIDGYFCLDDDTDSSTTVEIVFIFQSASDDIMTTTTYDAIVVEQWTVIDGVAIKTDYVPLLQSLAPYGWKLMCVLPTPIVKTNSEGSLCTKQILFLQRPVLSHKRRDLKQLHIKGHNKRNMNSKKNVGEKILSAFSTAQTMERSAETKVN